MGVLFIDSQLDFCIWCSRICLFFFVWIVFELWAPDFLKLFAVDFIQKHWHRYFWFPLPTDHPKHDEQDANLRFSRQSKCPRRHDDPDGRDAALFERWISGDIRWHDDVLTKVSILFEWWFEVLMVIEPFWIALQFSLINDYRVGFITHINLI